MLIPAVSAAVPARGILLPALLRGFLWRCAAVEAESAALFIDFGLREAVLAQASCVPLGGLQRAGARCRLVVAALRLAAGRGVGAHSTVAGTVISLAFARAEGQGPKRGRHEGVDRTAPTAGGDTAADARTARLSDARGTLYAAASSVILPLRMVRTRSDWAASC